MPAGSTSGSKLTVADGPPSSLSMLSIVSVPASTCSRSGGHGDVASLVGSPGCPIVRTRRHCSGLPRHLCDQRVEEIVRIAWRRRAAAAANGWSGTIDHRTGIALPDELHELEGVQPVVRGVPRSPPRAGRP